MSVKGFNIEGTIEKYDYNALDNLPEPVDVDSNIIVVQDEQPTDEGTKLWIKGTGSGVVQVPTYEEFQELANSIPITRGDGALSLIGINDTHPNVATGKEGIALGGNNQSTAPGAVTIGTNNIASAQNAVAIGSKLVGADPNTASAPSAIALGLSCEASGYGSVAIGYNTTSSGIGSTSMGYQTSATNDGATASGYGTVASGTASAAIGYQSTASGTASVAIGRDATASGYASTALGRGTNASASQALAAGRDTKAEAIAATALGYGTDATGARSFVAGAYNAPDTNEVDTTHGSGTRKYLMIVGNGTADDARSNAATLDWDGNLEVAGDVVTKDGSFSNLKSAINNLETVVGDSYDGDDDHYQLDITLIRDKYANYQYGTVLDLSGCNVAEFNVENVVSFTYLYTIDSQDLRGLYFVNEFGTAMDPSYQTLSTSQEITVPDWAVTCYASVSEIEDIADVVFSSRPDASNKSIVERISSIETAIGDFESGGNIDIHAVLHEDQYANYQYGTTSTLEGCNVVEFDVSNIIRFRYYYTIPSPDLRGLYFTNSNGVAIDPSYQTLTEPQDITVPNGAIKCYASVSTINDIVVLDSSQYSKPILDRIGDLESAVYNESTSSNPLARIQRDPGYISIFRTVGCIGDSLSSGECVYKINGSNGYIDLYEFSWGQYLARMTGNTYYNFSEGGISTRSWLSAEAGSGFGPQGIHAFDGNHKCTCYFIGLGQNDKNNNIPVGTISDINLSNYSQNADTYCGNMGKIIQKIKEHQPKAPIFVFTDPNPPGNDQSYNNVVPSIVALFNNVWLIDFKTYASDLFRNSAQVIGSQNRVGHFSALGYLEIAYVIATYVDWIIRHNLNSFSQVEFIGTNYEYS